MPRKLEFATGGSGDGGAEGKKINVVYPPDVQRKLDDALGVVEKAGSAAERAETLAKYKQLVDEAGAEQQERMRLVDFRGEKIHNFELQALKKIVEQINEDYAEQRKVDLEFDQDDVGIDDLTVGVEDGKVILMVITKRELKTMPEGIRDLTNLRVLDLGFNQIIEISGIEGLTTLKELYLSHNQIIKISGLKDLINLRRLGFACNQVTEISGFAGLIKLKHLWLQDNPIDQNIPANAAELARLRRSGVKVEI